MKSLPILLAATSLAATQAPAAPIGAIAPVQVTLTLKNHRFTPQAITAPAGAKIIITLINTDSAFEEFDSSDLHVEQDITPKAKVRFGVGPLKTGVYRFMGEAHPETALGQLVVSAP